MDIEEIMDFIVLAEARSFSKAAELRFVTQSAFSRRIQSLETSLNTVLFDRSMTPIALTKEGERFLVHAKSIADAVAKAKDEVKSQISAMPNPVYIAMPHSLSVTFFPQWYRELLRYVPELSVRVTTDSASKCVMDLRKGISDFALVMLADGVTACFDFEGIETTEIGTDHLVAVRSNRLPESSMDLLAYPRDSYMFACFERALEGTPYAQNGRTVFESPSSELLKAMTLSGFGVSVLQERMVEDDISDGYLVPACAEKLPCRILLLRTTKKMSPAPEVLWQAATRQA